MIANTVDVDRADAIELRIAGRHRLARAGRSGQENRILRLFSLKSKGWSVLIKGGCLKKTARNCQEAAVAASGLWSLLRAIPISKRAMVSAR